MELDDRVCPQTMKKAIDEEDEAMMQKPRILMGTRRWTVMAGILCVAALLARYADASAEPVKQSDSLLWEKARQYLSQNHWIPGEIVQLESTFNLKGKLEEETRFVLGCSSEKGGKIRLRLVAAEENGKDIARKIRSSVNGDIPLEEFKEDSPFTPQKGESVTSMKNGKERSINGHICSGFDFVMQSKDETVEGTAWLDQKTGLPVEMHSRVISVPFTMDGVKITAFEAYEYFSLTPQGHCLMDRSKAEMEIEISKYRFKGKVISESTFKDHWEYEGVQ